MSKRQQQRKRRNRPFDPLKAAGYDNRPHKHGILWRMLHNRWIVLAGMSILVLSMVTGTLAALNGSGGSGSNARVFQTATPEPSATATPDPNASPTPTPSPTATPIQRQYASAPEMQIDTNKQYFATVNTDKGAIRIQLFPKDAPQAVNSFVFLAKNHYYDGLTFNRVIPGFVAQAGDAGGNAPGYSLPVEKNSLSHDTGAVAMARNNATGQLSGQFYILMQDDPRLDGQDTVIGKVVSGQDVLQKLTPRQPERDPNAPPGDTITSITIEESATG